MSERLEKNEARLFLNPEGGGSARFTLGAGAVSFHSERKPGTPGRNEDAAALVSLGEEGAVLAVADGLGGAPAGEQASAIAVQCLVRAVQEAVRAEREIRDGILSGFDRANEEILALGVGAATTLAVTEVNGGSARAYHVGDSFALVTGGRGKVKMSTISHSPVGYGVASGLLNAEDAMYHEERHVISNVIGSSTMRIEVGFPLALNQLDTLVLGSDGLSDNLHTEEIVECVRKGSLGRASRELARMARERMEHPDGDAPSKPDDLTFLLFRPTRR